MLNELELTGRARTHIVQRDDLGAAMHSEVIEPFFALQKAAARDGFKLKIVSGFRDFDAQLRIWNMKYRGERPLYDACGNVRDHAALDATQLVDAILCWSALPGASRHHWGTDFDVVDAGAMPEGYRVRLLPEEFARGGVFRELGMWLDENIGSYGFFRPYGVYRGGVHPEPWHLSHAALATAALQLLTTGLIAETLRESDLMGKEEVLAQLPEIHRRYVLNITSHAAWAAQCGDNHDT